MFESFWINHPSESLATKIPASRAIRQSDVNVSWCPVYGAIPAIPLPNSVWYCPPNTSTSLGSFWVHDPLDAQIGTCSVGCGIKAATDLTVLLRIEKLAILSNPGHVPLAFPGSEAHFEIGWQIEGSCYATHWCPLCAVGKANEQNMALQLPLPAPSKYGGYPCNCRKKNDDRPIGTITKRSDPNISSSDTCSDRPEFSGQGPKLLSPT